MKNDIGLKHIALELKISLVAVSRALKDYDDISEATKHKVRQKAIELGYVPRPVDKIKHKIIAVFVDSLVSAMFASKSSLDPSIITEVYPACIACIASSKLLP